MPPQAAAEVLVTPAQAYRGWRLHVRCATCRQYGILPVGDILGRLRCKRCGSQNPSSAELRHHMVSVWLVGDASDL